MQLALLIGFGVWFTLPLVPHRSYAVNNSRLRELRLRAGVTQRQLAVVAGYTERLIRKAETHGHLSGTTIIDLVGALKSLGVDVQVTDLFAEPIELAKRFMDAFELHTRTVLDHTRELFGETFVFTCAGMPPNPLAGTFEGLAGFQAWLNIFYGLFSRAPGHSLSPRYSCDGQTVLARYYEIVVVKEFTSPPIWVNLHFEIRDGKIIRMDDEYDTEVGSDFLRRIATTTNDQA